MKAGTKQGEVKNRNCYNKLSYGEITHIRKVRKETVPGSITVEAAFLFPIVIFMIFALIYLAFYLHDMCKIQGVVNGTLHKAGLALKHEVNLETGGIRYEDMNERGVFYLITGRAKQEEKDINYHILSKLSGGLLYTKIITVSSEIGQLSLSISVKTKTTVNLPIFGVLFGDYSATVIEGSYPLHNPEETLRACEVILDTGSQIKGVEQLKNKLQDILPSGEKGS